MKFGIWGRIHGTRDSSEWNVFSMIIPDTCYQPESVILTYDIWVVRSCPEIST